MCFISHSKLKKVEKMVLVFRAPCQNHTSDMHMCRSVGSIMSQCTGRSPINYIRQPTRKTASTNIIIIYDMHIFIYMCII